MNHTIVDRIHQTIQNGRYDMSGHAMDEMAEDNLNILDVENVLLHGRLARTESDHPRGLKDILEGLALDQRTPIGVVGRFSTVNSYLVITVYAITDKGE